MTKRTDFKHVQSTFAATPSHRVSCLCSLPSPTSHMHYIMNCVPTLLLIDVLFQAITLDEQSQCMFLGLCSSVLKKYVHSISCSPFSVL